MLVPTHAASLQAQVTDRRLPSGPPTLDLPVQIPIRTIQLMVETDGTTSNDTVLSFFDTRVTLPAYLAPTITAFTLGRGAGTRLFAVDLFTRATWDPAAIHPLLLGTLGLDPSDQRHPWPQWLLQATLIGVSSPRLLQPWQRALLAQRPSSLHPVPTTV